MTFPNVPHQRQASSETGTDELTAGWGERHERRQVPVISTSYSTSDTVEISYLALAFIFLILCVTFFILCARVTYMSVCHACVPGAHRG